MAAPGEDRHEVGGERLLTPNGERALWALAVVLAVLDVALVAGGVGEPGGPTMLTAAVGPVWALAALKAAALALAVAAWWSLPDHLRPAVPAVLAAVSAVVVGSVLL